MYFFVVALADKDQSEGIVLEVVDDPVFTGVGPEKGVAFQLFCIVGSGVFEQGEDLPQYLPELLGRQVVKERVSLFANEQL